MNESAPKRVNSAGIWMWIALLAVSVLCAAAIALTTAMPQVLSIGRPIVLGLAIGCALTLVVALIGAVRMARYLHATEPSKQGDESHEADLHKTFLARVRRSSMTGEDAGRKLGTQVGETLASVTTISMTANQALRDAVELAEQVGNGASAMEEINASIASLGRQVQQQNELVDQSAASVEQMSASIRSVAGIAESKKEVSQRLAEYTSTGTSKVAVSEQAIREVGERVKSVNTMLGVINEIAAQTNLLAMNAAIEAAHAGSYGRGFAVVASEIRNLAESTTSQASNIGADLRELVDRIELATDAVDSTGTAFRTIEDEARAVTAAFAEITASTSELAIGAAEVVTASGNLRGLSSQTAESTEEIKAGTTELATLLTRGRESAAQTRQSMESISERSGSITMASSRISELTRKNNQQIAEMLTLVGEMDDDGSAEKDAVRRLSIANAILEHMGWVATLRVQINGTDGAASAGTYPLIDWLEDEGVEAIDKDASSQILQLARQLGELGRTAVGYLEEGISQEAERSFQRVLAQSTTILERLFGQLQDDEVQWTPELSVNVREFDEHHRHLFGLINELYAAMKDGRGKDVLERTFDELLSYTSYHFGAEEAAFERCAFPHAEEHICQHKELVEKAVQLRADLSAGKELAAVEVMEFLRDWVTRHIKGHDKLYAPFLAEIEQQTDLEAAGD